MYFPIGVGSGCSTQLTHVTSWSGGRAWEREQPARLVLDRAMCNYGVLGAVLMDVVVMVAGFYF